MNWLTVIVAAAILGALAIVRRQSEPDGRAYANWLLDGESPPDDDQPDQLPTLLEEVAVTVNPTTYIPAAVSPGLADANERAFLDMIAFSEGTAGPDGYFAMFGFPAPGRIAANLDDHPGLYFEFEDRAGNRLKTSAAGRYQFLLRTWRELQRSLNLPDFGPASQDAAALELVRQRGALNDVRAGRLQSAISKCAKTWASLPGAGYNQPERKLPQLVAAYQQAGGAIEA